MQICTIAIVYLPSFTGPKNRHCDANRLRRTAEQNQQHHNFTLVSTDKKSPLLHKLQLSWFRPGKESNVSKEKIQRSRQNQTWTGQWRSGDFFQHPLGRRFHCHETLDGLY
jgi:hypothetical protein